MRLLPSFRVGVIGFVQVFPAFRLGVFPDDLLGRFGVGPRDFVALNIRLHIAAHFVGIVFDEVLVVAKPA